VDQKGEEKKSSERNGQYKASPSEQLREKKMGKKGAVVGKYRRRNTLKNAWERGDQSKLENLGDEKKKNGVNPCGLERVRLGTKRDKKKNKKRGIPATGRGIVPGNQRRVNRKKKRDQKLAATA